MLRLWPETIVAGLFPGACWLQHGRHRVDFPADGRSWTGADDLLRALDAMLGDFAKSAGKHARLRILVSDSVAALAALPWQEQLSSTAELNAYALACFEHQGQPLDEGWIMQATFRRFRGAGLAYALPRPWMEQLLEIAALRSVRLDGILPMSAAAYWRRRRADPRVPTVLLLLEMQRITALIYDRGQLLTNDVQPVTGDAKSSMARLLRRVSASHDVIGRAEWWSARSADMEFVPAVFEQCLPNVNVLALDEKEWC
ncbi:hypothetical protein [Rugamonas apoptosis]|uniref:Uncharacterized protein n=1 Tax=Rugamonas apoptosis TaxID=2758570 RepID=A0A7W2IMY2_9BURK|nr:hypothetical protein [Rugamonas apoptosis]MBA5689972.1 hypothetical protein [Rugamonas apoptosis]